MINRLIATGCYAAALLVGLATANGLEIGTPGGVPAPSAKPATIAGLTSIDCRAATTMVEAAGYRNVVARDCAGLQYRFEAERGGVIQVIVFSAASGGMTALPR